MRQIAFMAILLMMYAASVHAQTDDVEASSQDSLQVTEVTETEVTETEVTEPEIPEAELPTEDITVTVVPNDPSSVVQEFLHSLKTGDSFMISQLISSDGLDEIGIMLEILKENLDKSEETTMSRLTAAGYTATADEIDDWSPMDYLTITIVLPVMQARYSLYEIQIGDYSNQGSELIIPLLFRTASGVELPYQTVLEKEDNQWKVTNFMGLNSFP